MKIFSGKVISKKMDKTATVAVERIVAHPIYKKRMKRVRKYHVHDEANSAKVGDVVRFVGTKPYSKLKRWKLFEEATDKKAVKKIRKPVKSSKGRSAASRKGENK